MKYFIVALLFMAVGMAFADVMTYKNCNRYGSSEVFGSQTHEIICSTTGE